MESTTATITPTSEAPAATAGDPADRPERDTPSTWEKIEAKADHLEDALERMLHEGTVRRIVVKDDGKVVAEFPLAVGVVGTVLAAPVAAIGAIIALLSDCTIEVERVEPAAATAVDSTEVVEKASPVAAELPAAGTIA